MSITNCHMLLKDGEAIIVALLESAVVKDLAVAYPRDEADLSRQEDHVINFYCL